MCISLIYHNRFDYNMIKSTNDINFRRTLFYGALEMILTLTLDILVDSIPSINNNILGGTKEETTHEIRSPKYTKNQCVSVAHDHFVSVM